MSGRKKMTKPDLLRSGLNINGCSRRVITNSNYSTGVEIVRRDMCVFSITVYVKQSTNSGRKTFLARRLSSLVFRGKSGSKRRFSIRVMVDKVGMPYVAL
ncbi:hypothetical protein C5167_001056 [Papaver somniferum]|uniref:Uncharacterized protein n=1 Tax=Papaver somniferum TaxID=3469 RepID=A0A4Y7KU83_PAPSO|nr:hypothetical protein C5167_001056 [Papaver somniferum]